MSDKLTLSRRSFFKAGIVAGISVYIAPWGPDAFAELFEEKLLTPIRWDPRNHKTAFRIDGVAKVTGQKIFAQDIRARDMRFAGISLSACSRTFGSTIFVSINPGATQLTVMARLASSSASALVAPMIPALAAL